MTKGQVSIEFLLSYLLYLVIVILMISALVKGLNKIKMLSPNTIDIRLNQNIVDVLNLKLINHCKNNYSKLPLANVVVINNVAYTNINGKWQRINIIGGASQGECI